MDCLRDGVLECFVIINFIINLQFPVINHFIHVYSPSTKKLHLVFITLNMKFIRFSIFFVLTVANTLPMLLLTSYAFMNGTGISKFSEVN